MSQICRGAGDVIVIIFLLVASAAGHCANAQTPEKYVHSREQLWLGVYNQTRFSKHWGMWLDFHYRMTDNFVGRKYQFILRSAITYYIQDNVRIHVGYASAWHFPENESQLTRREHRVWQQIAWNQKHTRVTALQAIRIEQRFQQAAEPDGKPGPYHYNLRVRYNIGFLIPLKGTQIKPKIPFAAISNEVLLNFGSAIIYNTFDQNRIFAGAGYQITQHLSMQAGYMNIYKQEASGNNYTSTHTIRLFVYHALDLRRKEKNPPGLL